MDLSVKPVNRLTGESSRKRIATPNKWKRAQAKNNRYTSKGFPKFPTCNHKDGSLLCRTLTGQDIRRFHSKFYAESNKIYQDNFILKFITMHPIKRRRPKNNKNKMKEARAKYFIRNLAKQMIPVCCNTFLNALNVSRNRVNRIAERFYSTGEMAKERRGGDRTGNKFAGKKEAIMKFVNSLQCSETQYCCNRTGRKYLPAELNIKTLWRMYMSENENQSLKVKEPYFRYIFNRNYNLGFGSPRVDVCSTCLKLTEQMKSCDEEKKNLLRTEKRVHKLRAAAFYDLLKENREDILILSFDCQKNQPLPKLPDQSTYYSRQLYLSHFCVVKGHSKSKLTKENVIAYVWSENEFKKGSNEISSCLEDCLNSIDMTPYTIVRLISDGCGGQNKNTILVTMVCSWFLNAPSNVSEIQLVFPITGHSFIPPDRVFGNIEKEIRKHETIISPDHYTSIIGNFATVKKLGIDVLNKDWKKVAQELIRKPGSWHFGLQSCKRIYITKKAGIPSKVLVQGEPAYRLKPDPEQSARSITKRGKTLNNVTADIIPISNCVSNPQKKEDVDVLLKKHYGDTWRSIKDLHFFRHVLDGAEIRETGDEEEECHITEELPAFQI